MFKPQKGDEAFAAEGQVEAPDEGAIAVKAEADAVRDVHVPDRQVLS
jgi:hypothetical protein